MFNKGCHSNKLKSYIVVAATNPSCWPRQQAHADFLKPRVVAVRLRVCCILVASTLKLLYHGSLLGFDLNVYCHINFKSSNQF